MVDRAQTTVKATRWLAAILERQEACQASSSFTAAYCSAYGPPTDLGDDVAGKNGNGNGDLGFTAELFKAADKLRGNLEPSEYKHVALGLIFLKYISDAFEAQRAKLAKDQYADTEDPEEYLADNVFWVPKEARWSHLQANAKRPEIGKLIDEAMEAIEKAPSNDGLKGVLPKNYARPTLNKTMLGELIDLFSNIGMHDSTDKARDLLGRVYEYFLSGFASSEGKRGGEFFTPRSVVRTLLDAGARLGARLRSVLRVGRPGYR